MKRIFSSIFLAVLFSLPCLAQIDRSKAPGAAVAPIIHIGTPQSFVLKNGMKVFVVENHKIPMVTYSLSLEIQPALQGEKAGLYAMAGDLLMMGTPTRTKDQIDEAIDFIGAEVNSSSVGIAGRSLKKFSNQLLSVMSDVVLNPIFPEEQLEKLKKQTITGIVSGKEDPGAISENISKRMLFGDHHPYGEIISEKSIEAITSQDCKNYHQTYFRPNVAYLVIVGDITLKEAKKQVTQYFAKWERGVVPQTQYESPRLNDENRIVVGNKDGGNQSAVRVTHIVDLKPGHPDAIKVSVMNNVLGGGSFSARLFRNLREDKAWTYGSYSSLSPDKLVGSFEAEAMVKAEATDSALFEMMKEIKELQQNQISEQDLSLFKNMMAGSFARSLEDPAMVARFALNIERYKLPQDYYTTYLEKLAAVTPADVLEMANKYLKPNNAYLVAVGDLSKIKKGLRRLTDNGKIMTYDYYGVEVKQNAIPSGLTAQKVIDDYINAIGGRQKLEGVKSMSSTATAAIQGMSLTIKSYIETPAKLCVETYLQNNLMSKQVLNGKSGKVSSPMGEQVFDEQTVLMLQEESVMFPELQMSANGSKTELIALEEINGEPAYKVSVVNAKGNESVLFFSAETGLKLKEVKSSAQGQAITLVKEYAEKDGVKIPVKITQSVGPQIVDMEINDIQINTAIAAEKFSI